MAKKARARLMNVGTALGHRRGVLFGSGCDVDADAISDISVRSFLLENGDIGWEIGGGRLIRDTFLATTADDREALDAWRKGKPLTKHSYIIDQDVCWWAYLEGVKEYGQDWTSLSVADASTCDMVLQVILLG